jgi:hypothetical protein
MPRKSSIERTEKIMIKSEKDRKKKREHWVPVKNSFHLAAVHIQLQEAGDMPTGPAQRRKEQRH